jgi:hypothetical protein
MPAPIPRLRPTPVTSTVLATVVSVSTLLCPSLSWWHERIGPECVSSVALNSHYRVRHE